MNAKEILKQAEKESALKELCQEAFDIVDGFYIPFSSPEDRGGRISPDLARRAGEIQVLHKTISLMMKKLESLPADLGNGI